jgi:hypothetical protein
MSRTGAVPGHQFMTNSPDRPDLAAIERAAAVEIAVAQTLVPTDAAGEIDLDLATAELGYYEAELGSLRDAAAILATDARAGG